MYRLGHRQAHHYLLYGIAVLALAATVFGAVQFARNYFQPHTILKQSAPITHTVSGAQTTEQLVTKPLFGLQLPAGWHEVAAPQVRAMVYSWAGKGAYDAARRLDIYIDADLSGMAFNHLLPVESASNQLQITGTVSDNCTNFTDKTTTSATTGTAPSKWGGVNFLCDMANYERDTVAIGSSEGLNGVTLRGGTAGAHRVLLVYTDNNNVPDYTIFVAIVKSFYLD